MIKVHIYDIICFEVIIIKLSKKQEKVYADIFNGINSFIYQLEETLSLIEKQKEKIDEIANENEQHIEQTLKNITALKQMKEILNEVVWG